MRRALISATLTGILILGACGGDDEESSNDDSTEQESEDNGSSDDGSDETVPDISVGNIPGVSDECEELYTAWLNIFAGIGVPGAPVADPSETIEALQAALPDDLDDDAAVFGAAISQYFAVLAEYGDDSSAAFTDPEVMAALEGLGAEEVTEASNNISAYFDEACPAAG